MYTENNQIDDSKLKALPTEGGFTVPIGYFDNMRKQVLRATTGLEASETFTVPDGYFEQSRMAILAKTSQKQVTLPLWHKRSVVKYAAAAAVIITFGLSFIFYPKHSQATLQSMTNDEIIFYLEEEGAREISVSEVSFAVNEPQTNSEEQYLMNTVDEQSIIEEL